MPVATMRTSTSPARGASRSSVSMTGKCAPSRSTAAAIFMGALSFARFELGRSRRLRRRGGTRGHLDLALPRYLIPIRPRIHLQMLEQPHAIQLHAQVVARADAEQEVRA